MNAIAIDIAAAQSAGLAGNGRLIMRKLDTAWDFVTRRYAL
jgi:hypothetical protein